MSKLVAIDNGHGQNTAGKRTPKMPDGRVIHEWEFNHPTAKKLEQILKRCGLNTLMVSDTKADTSLGTRVNRANNAKADVFVSIHYNAYKSIWGNHGGIETFHYTDPLVTAAVKQGNSGAQVQRLQTVLKVLGYYTGTIDSSFGLKTLAAVKAFQKDHGLPQDGVVGSSTRAKMFPKEKDKKLATLVQKELVEATKLRNRGVKSYNFYVCRRTVMPAILCECGFMDNLAEASLMLNEDYQWKVAEAIAKGICAYLGVKYTSVQASQPEPKPSPVPKPESKPAKPVSPPANKIVALKRGDKSSAVTKLQKDLIALGFAKHMEPWGADGSYGKATENAVIAFQKAHKLKVDGKAGPETQGKIGDLLTAKKPTPQTNTLYRVQSGAFKNKANADARLAAIKKIGFKDAQIRYIDGLYKVQVGAYSVKSNADNAVQKLRNYGFDAYIPTVKPSTTPTPAPKPQPKPATKTIKVGSKVKVKKGAKSYEGKKVADFIYSKVYTVDQLKGNRAVLDLKGICTAFHIKDLILQ